MYREITALLVMLQNLQLCRSAKGFAALLSSLFPSCGRLAAYGGENFAALFQRDASSLACRPNDPRLLPKQSICCITLSLLSPPLTLGGRDVVGVTLGSKQGASPPLRPQPHPSPTPALLHGPPWPSSVPPPSSPSPRHLTTRGGGRDRAGGERGTATCIWKLETLLTSHPAIPSQTMVSQGNTLIPLSGLVLKLLYCTQLALFKNMWHENRDDECRISASNQLRWGPSKGASKHTATQA